MCLDLKIWHKRGRLHHRRGSVGRNPISILVPYHRVLGKNQALTRFGGGLPNKRFLLQLEGIVYKDKGIEFVKPKTKKW